MTRPWLLIPVVFLLGCSRGNRTPPSASAPGPRDDSSALEVRPGQSIQAAIDAAKPGQIVLVQPGTYKASSPGEAMIVFRPAHNGVILRGAGASPADVVIDGNRRVLHVIFFDKGIDRSTVVENLTVTGGHAFPNDLLPAGHRPVLRPELEDFGNDFYHDGAGLMLFLCSPTIRNCRVVDNRADMCGGGISVFCPAEETFPETGPLLFGNQVINNSVEQGTGGGIDVYFRAKADIVNNLLVGNKGWGAAIAVLDGGSATIDFATIVGNHGLAFGMHGTATVRLTNSIFAGNEDAVLETPGTIALSHCCFWKNEESSTPPPGSGHIHADPLFVKGPRGEYCLSQTASGQSADSPCVNAGSHPAASSAVRGLTTRIDGAPDSGVADIGFHAQAAAK